MRTIYVNQFDGGMVYDPRDPRENICRTCQHFDAFTLKYRLSPYRSSENGDSSSAANIIGNFEYDGTTVFGLGVNSAAAIFTRTNFTDATWTSLITVSGSVRVDADLPFFTYYKKTGKLYGVRGARYVWSVDPVAPSANNVEADLTAYTTVSNGVVHSKDDILYVGYDNKIAKNDNGSWTVAALTLPSDIIISSICEYMNYLAIGCRRKSGIGSVVYLWDKDTSLTTLSESINWGEGNLMVLEELEGALIGVSFEGTTGSYNIMARTTFRYYSGTQGAVKFAEFNGFNQSPTIMGTNYKRKVHNRIFFPASIPINTSAYFGVWSIGRNSVGVPFAVTLDRLYSTAFNGSFTPYGLILLGDYMFTGYTINGVAIMDKTDDVANYTTTSVYETSINPQMPSTDRPQKKKLISVGALYEALPSGAQVVVKYKVDGGSFLTVFTETTTNAVRTEPSTRASAAQFTDGTEYEFRIESTGGAVVTGLTYKYQVIPTN
jgi:hypothetical protein